MEKKTFLTRYNSFVLPAVLVLLSFFLRLSLISKGPYNVDCLNLAVQAQKTLATGQIHFLPVFGYPVTVLVAALFIAAAQTLSIAGSVLAVNFMSVVFGAISVGFFCLVIKELFDMRSAIIAGILFSLSPIFLAVSVYGMSHAPFMAFYLAGIYVLCRFLRTGEGGGLVLAGSLLGLAGGARFQDMVLVLPSALYLLACPPLTVRDSSQDSLSQMLFSLLSFLIVVGTVSVACHVVILFQDNGPAYVENLLFRLGWGLGANNFCPTLFRSLAVLGHLVTSLTVGGILLSAFGIIFVFRRCRRSGIFLLLWLVVPLLYYGNHASSVSSRYLTLCVPVFSLTQGVMLASLLSGRRLQKILAWGFVLWLAVVPFSRVYPQLRRHHRHNILPNFVRWVEGNTGPRARIITADERLFYSVYSNRLLLVRPMNVQRSTPDELKEFRGKLDVLLEQEVPVYFTTASLFAYDRDQHFSTFINDNYDLEVVGRYPYEDWHLGTLRSQVFLFELIRVKEKQHD